MRGTYYFVYRVGNGFSAVRLACYSREQAFWMAEQKWNDGKHSKYTQFAVEYVECGEWQTVKSWI